MAKPKNQGAIPVRVRQSINWRIPIDLIDGIDAQRKRTRQDRTAWVVEAIQAKLRRGEP